jgi:hypothetical protein
VRAVIVVNRSGGKIVTWEYKIETISLDLEDALKGSATGALNEWGREG